MKCCVCGGENLEPALRNSIAGIHGLPIGQCAWCPSCKIHVEPIWGDTKPSLRKTAARTLPPTPHARIGGNVDE